MAQSITPSSTANVKIGKGKTALIIDDMATMRMLLATPCRQLGFKVEMATNGRAALKRILHGLKHPTEKVDFVLCDWFMPPGIDGVEVLEELHYRGALEGDMLFFMVTAQDSINEIFRAAEAILPGYITKPNLTLQLLEKKIIASMRMQKYQSELKSLIVLEKKNVREKNVMLKYGKSIDFCKRIFKEMQQERVEKLREMQKNRVLFLTKKYSETQKMVGEYGNEQREKLGRMLQAAKRDLMKPSHVDVPTWPLRRVAEIFEDEGWLDAALQQYQSILTKINPKSAWVYVDAGRILEKKGDYENAILHYRKAVTLNRKFQKARDCLVNLFQKLGRKNEAIEILEEAVALSPEKPDRQKLKGDIHLSFDSETEAVKAEESYRKVLEIEEKLNQNQIGNNTNLAKALLLQPKRIVEAKEYLDLAIELSSNETYKAGSDALKESRLVRGEYFLKTKDLESAKQDFEFSLKLVEDDECQLNNNQVSGKIGDIYFRNGHDKKAMEWMTQFIGKDPKNQEKQAILKEVLTKNNHERDIKGIIDAAMDQAFQHVREVNSQCLEYRKHGRYLDAVTQYSKIIFEHPSDDGLWFNKGRALHDYALSLEKNDPKECEKRLSEAKYHFKKAMELEKGYLEMGGKPRILEALLALKYDDDFMKDIIPKEKKEVQ